MRWVPYRHLLIMFNLATPVPVFNDVVQPVKIDIQCNASGQYIGGIDREYFLTIGGPADRRWRYVFSQSPGSPGCTTEINGTYDLIDDLAIFNGRTDKNIEVQFGLNYGIAREKIVFNAFFPISDTTLRYRRRWFRKIAAEWRAVEEVTLFLPRTANGQLKNKWHSEITGDRLSWDEEGKATLKRIQTGVTISLDGMLPFLSDDNIGNALVRTLAFVLIRDDRWDGVRELSEEQNTIGFLRGFHPGVAYEAIGRFP